MKNYHKLIIFIVLLLIGFGIAILSLSWPLLTGKTYVLSTAPVDPFDIFRGQYLTISYEISSISNITDISELDIGNYVYVVLEKDSAGISRPVKASLEKPKGEDFIRGKIKAAHGNSVRVEYGIEQFFFERGATFSRVNLTVEVRVGSSGQARISRLLQNNEPLDIEYRENYIAP